MPSQPSTQIKSDVEIFLAIENSWKSIKIEYVSNTYSHFISHFCSKSFHFVKSKYVGNRLEMVWFVQFSIEILIKNKVKNKQNLNQLHDLACNVLLYMNIRLRYKYKFHTVFVWLCVCVSKNSLHSIGKMSNFIFHFNSIDECILQLNDSCR